MRRSWQTWLAAAALLVATYPARAQEDDPARSFPADTFLYVEADAAVRGPSGTWRPEASSGIPSTIEVSAASAARSLVSSAAILS